MIVDERGRTEAGLLHAEARRLADTQQALSEVLGGSPSVPVQDREPGHDRPHRWLLVAAAAVVLLVAATAIAVVRRGSHDTPRPAITSPATTTVPATTAVPTTTALVTTTSPATTVVATTTPVAVAPVSDVFVTVSGDHPSVVDVRDAVGVVASYDLGCPSGSDCLVQSARVMGDTIWVAITSSEPGKPNSVVGSRVVSVTRSTGELVTHLALDGSAEVWSAGRGADGTLYAYIDAPVVNEPPERSLVAIEDGRTRVLATGLSGFRLSDDGRFLAVGFATPEAGERARFEVTDLIDGTTASFRTDGVFDGPGAWSPDGRRLVVNDQWEKGTAWVVDPWSGSGNPIAGAEGLGNACFMSDDVIAHATWNVGYGQGDAQVGVIRLTSLATGATVADFGDGLFGAGLRCHPDGSVTYLRRPVIEVQLSPGFSQPEPDDDAPVELVHIAPDGTTSVGDTGDLRMV